MSIGQVFVALTAACFLTLAMAAPGTAAEQRAGARAAGSSSLPRIKKDCAVCHVSEAGRTSRRLKKGPSQLCLDCHGDHAAQAGHRVGMAPSMDVNGLPLADGRMTCVTCHDMHTNTHGALLRMPARDLCQACHRK
jgi:predicted CXXCH cytochrome family protein